jgi:type 1 glutamine amidotransferase
MRRVALALSLLAAPALLSAAAPAAAPVRVLILTGQSDMKYHDWRKTTPFFARILGAAGRFETRVVEEPRGITRESLAPYAAVVVNYNGPRWGRAAERALEEFVRDGGGLVSFHGVTYGPFMGTVPVQGKWTHEPAWEGWSQMLGATWAAENIGHAPRGAFTVKPRTVQPQPHAITDGMAPEFTVSDELYHKLDLRPGVEVVATAFDDPARHGTGKDEPMAWVNRFGKGRVFHCTLGHDTAALYQPSVMALLARGTEWAATGAVTLPATLQLDAPPANAPRVLVVTGGHGYTPSFYAIFESDPEIRWWHATSQKEAFTAKMRDRYDVVVLYDLYNQIGDAEREHLRAFVEAGKGVVSLHHSIVDYTSWPWWYEEVTGGKYFEKAEGEHPASHYKDDVPMTVRVTKGQERHPILHDVGDLVTVDECYSGMWHAPGIATLLEVANEWNDRPVVYTGPNPRYRSVYIQLGHGAYTHAHPGYRKLVHNAIFWAAGQAAR